MSCVITTLQAQYQHRLTQYGMCTYSDSGAPLRAPAAASRSAYWAGPNASLHTGAVG